MMSARHHSRSRLDKAAAVFGLSLICLFGLATLLAANLMATGQGGEGASYWSTWGNIASLAGVMLGWTFLALAVRQMVLERRVAVALLAAAVTWVAWWLLVFAFT